MKDTPVTPPVIAPVPAGVVRPLWSVMIPVHNCAHYLTETLESVLVQNIPAEQMQIEVVDDASTDADVAALVMRVGQGRVQYFRQPQNVGSLCNFETCLTRSRGQLVHLLHGDDRVEEGYYKAIAQIFAQFPSAGAAFCRYNWIDQNSKPIHLEAAARTTPGVLENGLMQLAERNIIQYAAITVRREVYESLGSFSGVNYGEDWEMWVRIARDYPIAYTPVVLASYRKHTASISGQKYTSGQHLRDLEQVMQTIQQHLPTEARERLLQKSKKFYAGYGLRIANQIWHTTHDKAAVRAQVKQTLQLHKSSASYYAIARLYLKMLLGMR
ncbi:glycosyltransferase family 2 protein [Pontibacter akesuensis]|uniref:Glycosyltransferase involved in cell wall bisynthesis n=1 Tax=Pontibacter akesuensis TaxID=388950 RepID=A0A1I7GIM7_9BACT|nr:glycosyltransferase [Pontibacter akesuensis]GHA56681.1 hypothetical protein GCM10007389_05400 [Pontibacter akesuensis]SFU48116.1 Glycosyltransferase involved in cell wall bisynthesis [Pontibacter akesuensis]